MRNVALSLVILGSGLSLVAQQTITCTSSGTRRQLCPADTSNGVVLVRELSDHVCQQGSTWSYSRQGISVSGGCSADFQVSGNSNNNHNYGSGAYDNRTDANGNAIGPGYGNNNGGYGNRGGRRGGVIPAGTQLAVRLDQAVRPTEVSPGESVSMSLVNDLSVNGRVLAPAGTPVQGKITSERGSPLDLRLSSMNVNGQTYALSSNSVHSLRDSQNGNSNDTNQSTKSQLGSLLGGVVAGNQLPSGSVFSFRLTSSAQPGGIGQ